MLLQVKRVEERSVEQGGGEGHLGRFTSVAWYGVDSHVGRMSMR